MEITLELDDALATALRRMADAKGETPAGFAKRALEEQLNAHPLELSMDERSKRIDEALEKLRLSNVSLGRNGRPWREFIHEGHRY